jgi:hypothetical protein
VKEDKLFGKIAYEGLWIGETVITMFDTHEKIALYINGEEDDEFSSNQREAFSNFQSGMDSIMNEVKNSIFAHYLNHYQDYRAMRSNADEVEKIVPHISSCRKLEKLVKPTTQKPEKQSV